MVSNSINNLEMIISKKILIITDIVSTHVGRGLARLLVAGLLAVLIVLVVGVTGT